MLKKIETAAKYLNAATDNFAPQAGIVLGTGLGGLVEHIDIKYSVEYSEIPDFPLSTVEGHSGKLIFGMLGGKRVVAMQGRFHYYEGYQMWQVVFPIRVMHALGIKTLMVSNAAGGINSTFSKGDLMVIDDHINLLPNVLVGKNIAELGPRFPDMTEPYSRELIELATKIADEKGIKLQYGCYVATTGPTYETPAEYNYFRVIGGDAVGMSTAPEVIAARHMGLPVFGVSIITNLGFSGVKNDHTDVTAVGKRAEGEMTAIFTGILERI